MTDLDMENHIKQLSTFFQIVAKISAQKCKQHKFVKLRLFLAFTDYNSEKNEKIMTYNTIS